MCGSRNCLVKKTAQVKLASDPSREVRMGLLQSEYNFINSLHPLAQEVLARDSDHEVRELLALYPALVPKVQTMLATDESADVREALAKRSETAMSNIALYQKAQQRLAKYQSYSVDYVVSSQDILSSDSEKINNQISQAVTASPIAALIPQGAFNIFKPPK